MKPRAKYRMLPHFNAYYNIKLNIEINIPRYLHTKSERGSDRFQKLVLLEKRYGVIYQIVEKTFIEVVALLIFLLHFIGNMFPSLMTLL